MHLGIGHSQGKNVLGSRERNEILKILVQPGFWSTVQLVEKETITLHTVIYFEPVLAHVHTETQVDDCVGCVVILDGCE